MDAVVASLAGVPPFLIYFVPAVLIVHAFMWLYMQVTPHAEIELIKANNVAASTTYVGALLGFSIPICSVVANAASLVDFLVWSLVAGFVQLATFLVFRRFYPRISERIEAGEMGVAVKLAGTSVVVGLLNAASIVY